MVEKKPVCGRIGSMQGRFPKYFFVAVLLLAPLFITPVSAQADTLNQRALFNVDASFDSISRNQITATLFEVSNHGYFYVEDQFYNGLSAFNKNRFRQSLANLAQVFDSQIYPAENNFWGKEPNPGIDGDARVVILLTPMKNNIGGYFDSNNQNLKSVSATSNQREMLHINARVVLDENNTQAFLAHEFQHLISFNQKELINRTNEDFWLNELRSEYSISFLGYNNNFPGSTLERRVSSFLQSPQDSLTEWKNQAEDYATVSLFGEYLTEQYGASILSSSLQGNSRGIPSLEEALKSGGYGQNFKDVFSDWLIALAVNDISQNNKFGFFREGLKNNVRVPISSSVPALGDNLDFEQTIALKDWQGYWLYLGGFLTGQKNVLNFDFSGSALIDTTATLLVIRKDGSVEKILVDLNLNRNKIQIDNLDSIAKIYLMPFKHTKISGFSDNETTSDLAIKIYRTDKISPVINSPESSQYPDGTLLRAQGDYKVYIINNGFRRHIVSPRIFDFYGHLGFDKVIVVSPETVLAYPESRLIQRLGDKRVFELISDSQKEWLNISAEEFIASGRRWEQIFIVNDLEFNFYR